MPVQSVLGPPHPELFVDQSDPLFLVCQLNFLMCQQTSHHSQTIHHSSHVLVPQCDNKIYNLLTFDYSWYKKASDTDWVLTQQFFAEVHNF